MRSTFRLPFLVSVWFQILFHPPPGVLFTFPSRYWFTIGHQTYLALGDSTPGFSQGVFASRYLRTEKVGCSVFAYRTIAFFGAAFQPLRLTEQFVTNPTRTNTAQPCGRTVFVGVDFPALQPPSAPHSSSVLKMKNGKIKV